MSRRQAQILAQDWQLELLKGMFTQSDRPSQDQKDQVVNQTGLGEKWVTNWIYRERKRARKGFKSGTSKNLLSVYSDPMPSVEPQIFRLETARLQSFEPQGIPPSFDGSFVRKISGNDIQQSHVATVVDYTTIDTLLAVEHPLAPQFLLSTVSMSPSDQDPGMSSNRTLQPLMSMQPDHFLASKSASLNYIPTTFPTSSFEELSYLHLQQMAEKDHQSSGNGLCTAQSTVTDGRILYHSIPDQSKNTKSAPQTPEPLLNAAPPSNISFPSPQSRSLSLWHSSHYSPLPVSRTTRLSDLNTSHNLARTLRDYNQEAHLRGTSLS